MRSTAPLSTGMHIAIPLSGASAADTGRVALPESPCCRGRHDFPDDPLSLFHQGRGDLDRDVEVDLLARARAEHRVARPAHLLAEVGDGGDLFVEARAKVLREPNLCERGE